MTMDTVFRLGWLFLIYAFLGWCLEVVFVAVTSGQVVNRGFLNGPVCPIYGVGMLGVLLLLRPVAEHPAWLFFGGMVLCSVVELVGGWLLERLFGARWWDYSREPFNLGGYICLRFSLMWGLAVTFAVKLVHPAVLGAVERFPRLTGSILLGVLGGLFLADLTVTLVTVLGIRRRLGELQRVTDGLHALGDALSGRLGATALAADARLGDLKETGQEHLAARRQRLEDTLSATREELLRQRTELEEKQKRLQEEFRARMGSRRLFRAFPDIKQAIEDRLDRTNRR